MKHPSWGTKGFLVTKFKTKITTTTTKCIELISYAGRLWSIGSFFIYVQRGLA